MNIQKNFTTTSRVMVRHSNCSIFDCSSSALNENATPYREPRQNRSKLGAKQRIKGNIVVVITHLFSTYHKSRQSGDKLGANQAFQGNTVVVIVHMVFSHHKSEHNKRKHLGANKKNKEDNNDNHVRSQLAQI